MTKYKREIQKIADQFDRDVVHTKGNHLSLICRQGKRPAVFTSSSSGDPRTKKNLLKHLKALDHETGNPGKTTG